MGTSSLKLRLEKLELIQQKLPSHQKTADWSNRRNFRSKLGVLVYLVRKLVLKIVFFLEKNENYLVSNPCLWLGNLLYYPLDQRVAVPQKPWRRVGGWQNHSNTRNTQKETFSEMLSGEKTLDIPSFEHIYGLRTFLSYPFDLRCLLQNESFWVETVEFQPFRLWKTEKNSTHWNSGAHFLLERAV